MSEHGTITNSGATANPNGIHPIYAYADRQRRQPFDLVPLLFEGANTIQIRDEIAKAYGIVEKGYGKLYYRTIRRLNKLVKQGICIIEKGILFVGMGDVPRNYYRLTLAATNLTNRSSRSHKSTRSTIYMWGDQDGYQLAQKKTPSPEAMMGVDIFSISLLLKIPTESASLVLPRMRS